MRTQPFVVLLFALVLGFSTAACGSKSPTTPTNVSTVTVTGTAPSVGSTAQFVATATSPSGTTEDVTASATWASSNTSIATVSSGGMVTGVASGSVVITATFSGVAGTDAIAVP